MAVGPNLVSNVAADVLSSADAVQTTAELSPL